MEKKVRIWRCTRNLPYKDDAIGSKDLRERQGYYRCAQTEGEALAQMAILFPEEVGEFTVDLWR